MTATHLTKQRVEDCLTIGPPRGLLQDVAGTFYWKRKDVSVHYEVLSASAELKLITLRGRVIIQRESLVKTRPNLGGARWWFLCPKCSKRVSRLHRPVGRLEFFCRHCHDLTYESAQVSGTRKGKLLRSQAKKLRVSRYQARLLISATSTDEQFVVHE